MVRKHAGCQETGWSFTFAALHDKSGSTQRPSDFARDLRRVIAADPLPDYHLSTYTGERGDECLHGVRRIFLAPDAPGYDPDLLRQAGKRRKRPSKR